MQRWTAVLAVSLAAGFGCGAPMTPTKTVKIGVIIDRTGNNAEPSWSDAVKLAEKHANAALTKAGKNYRLSYELNNSQNDPATAVQQATTLVQGAARALIVDSSQNDVAVNKLHYDADMGNDLNVPIMCGGCTAGTINNPNATATDMVDQLTNRNGLGWNFRGIMASRLVAKVLVKEMLKTANGDANGDGKFKLALYGSDEAFGRATLGDLRTFANMLHPTPPPTYKEIRHGATVDANAASWATDTAKLVEQTETPTDGGMPVADGTTPDYVVVANFSAQQAATVRAYKTGMYTPKMFHVHTFRINNVITTLGALAEGSEGVSHVLIDNAEAGDVFKAEFEKEYSKPIAYRDATYYDIAMMFALGVMNAAQTQTDVDKLTGTEVRDAVRKLSDPAGEVVKTGADELGKALTAFGAGKAVNYVGASSPMDFDANQSVRSKLARYKVEGGKFIDAAKFDCVTNDDCNAVP